MTGLSLSLAPGNPFGACGSTTLLGFLRNLTERLCRVSRRGKGSTREPLVCPAGDEHSRWLRDEDRTKPMGSGHTLKVEPVSLAEGPAA